MEQTEAVKPRRRRVSKKVARDDRDGDGTPQYFAKKRIAQEAEDLKKRKEESTKKVSYELVGRKLLKVTRLFHNGEAKNKYRTYLGSLKDQDTREKYEKLKSEGLVDSVLGF